MNDFSKKGNRSNIHKFEKCILSSQKQRLRKTKKVQKALKALCDEDDNSDCFENSLFVVRSMQKAHNIDHYVKQDTNLASQKNILEERLIESFSESSSSSSEQDQHKKSKKYQKTKSIGRQNSNSEDSKLVMNRKCKSKKNRISDDSDDNSLNILLNKTAKQKYKKSKKIKSKPNNHINFNSESENDSINEMSNISKSLPKHTMHRKKEKIANSYILTKDKSKKHDSSNESKDDDIEYMKQKKSSINTLHDDKNEQKHKNHEKSLKRVFCEIQKDDSDTDSGKEFQKIKIQNVHSDKYSKKQLVDLEINRQKLVDLENEKREESVDEQTILDFDEAKEILKECKKICLNFVMYVDSAEQLYGKMEEQFLLKSTEKINKLNTVLEKKQKSLTTFYKSLSERSKTKKNIAIKKLHKTISGKEQFSADSEATNVDKEQSASENKCSYRNEQESKDVSECDSEEIFSADEMRTPQKKQITGDKKSRTNDLDNVNVEVGEDKMLMDESQNNNNNNTDLQDEESSTSPVLGTSEEKRIRTENTKSIEKQLFSENVDSNNKEIQLTDKDTDSKAKLAKLSTTNICDNEIISKNSSVKDDNKKMTLQNDEQTKCTNEVDIVNQSLDLFETCEREENEIETQKTDIKINYKKTKSLSKTKDFLDTYETSLQDKISDEKDNTSILNNEEEIDLLNQNNQKEMVSAIKEDIYDSSKEIDISDKMNFNVESDSEILAKKALLESDSDTSSNTVVNIKKTKDLNTNLKNEAGDNYSDVSSNTSTIVLSTFTKSKDDIESKAEVIDASENNQFNKKFSKENETSQTSDETNAKREQVAKKALLESSSSSDSSSIIFHSLSVQSLSESEEIDAMNKLNISKENSEAKMAHLASSNSESFSSELTSTTASETEISISKKAKNYDTDSDEKSLISRIKKKKLKLSRNRHYKKDKKLKMFCEVRLEKLNKNILKQYSHALKASKEYLEQKAFESLVNLDRLEKRYKRNKKIDSNTSRNDDKTFASSTISKSINKRKRNQTIKEESLMDHLKKIENDEVSAIVRTDSSSDESFREVKDINSISNEALMSEANEVAREHLLRSSDSDTGKDVLNSDESINNDDVNKPEDKKKKNQKKSNKTSKQDNDKKEKNDKSSWRQDKLLRMKFSDTDSDIEKKKWDKKQEKMAKESEKNSSDSDDEKKCLISKKKKIKRRILDSDSDVKLTDCSSDSDDIFEISKNKQNSSDLDIKKENQKRKRRKRGESNSSGTDSSFQEKKVKPKRKRIKKMASDSDSSDEDVKNSQGSTPVKSGRKNIRKVLKDKQVAEDTKLAAKEEEERLKRIAERQALYNEVYEMRLAGEEKVDKLVLDFDTETKEELVSIHKELVKRLKPHQAQGIKFMWDACFESLERVKTTSGSGCIIAHCMGLGKSLQVVALTHALLTHETTSVKTVLIVCPLSTVLNWLNEYNTWLKDLDDIDVYELTKYKKNFERKYQLQNWQKTGGVMIIGYEMFRNLTGPNKNIRKAMKEVILECLVDPGADLIVCDEGHLLKNEDTALSKCMRRVKTMRRIVLTGTPLQNNLIEYHCMVQFVKPNLLGTKKEFLNRFVNPITNGQFDDSTAYDVKLMKKRAHVLHKMLEGSVQRFDYSVLTPFLPPKQEYVIFVRLTDTQINMYQYYLDNLARRHHSGAGGTLFADFQALQRIWTHPVVLRLNAERIEKANEKKGFSSDTEGSLKDFINDDTTDPSNSSSSDSNSDSDVQAIDDIKKNVPRRKTRNNPGVEEPEEENKENKENKEENISTSEVEWWSQFVQPEHFKDIRVSAKLLLLFGILKECEQIGDKVLVFSQSLYSLTLIEEFLARIDDETQNNASLDILDNHSGSWSLGLDYFRLDGQTSAENRSIWCKIFNKPTNTRARLFLISTRAGGLGINLTAANRVIIFDASWNPSHDVQSIFRIYRFGQKKPCYVYRFLAAGTMEEKIYNRQVTKLSLSCRVVDEQQIERHYSNHNLNELYTFEPYSEENRPTLNLPKDRLLAEIFLKYKNVVENYHEHDSLLENKAEEELDEEERKQAWLEYEEEKKGKPLMNPMNNPAYQNNILLQQYNMMINSGQPSMISQGMSLQMEYENLQQLIRKDYPNATPEQQKNMTNRALMEMYNYWEKQATLCQPVRNLATASTNFQQRSMTMPHTVINSNVHQTTQLNQLLTSGQAGNYVNKSVQPNMTQRDLISNAFRNVSSINKTGKADDDIIEVPTTSNTSTLNAQVAIQSTSKSNNQEE